jgi:hypothetical protein
MKKTLLLGLSLMIGASGPALAKTDKKAEMEFYSPIPGPKNCFWLRGPHNKDPYINTAYPDAGAIYWGATFSMPEGAKLELQADFTYSRYQSLISYNGKGVPIDSLADYLIEPETGSVNPFVVGNNRNDKKRAYKVQIKSESLPFSRDEGVKLTGEQRNTLYAPFYAGNQQTIIYRIYVPNKGLDVDGGVDLPYPVLTLEDGSKVEGRALCDTLNTSQPLTVHPDALGITTTQYKKMLATPDMPDNWPATTPATWYMQLDRASLIGIYTGEMSENPRRSEGGFYPNPDNNYIRTVVNRNFGKVFVVRGKLPKTPQTHNGDAVMTSGELRYWSICSNQGFANTRVNDCLYDEQLKLDENGYYTVMVSRAEDRPRIAIEECGIGWLPMADDGDGVFDEDSSIVQIRNMLASDEFAHSVQSVTNPGEEPQIMGEYFPKTFYVMPNTAETFFACGGGK